MQVKAIPASGRHGQAADDIAAFRADDDEIRSLTVVDGSPVVSLTVPVSLSVLVTACWCDGMESIDGVQAMTDDRVREWAVSMLLTLGAAGISDATDSIAASPTTPEAAEYLKVIQDRVPRAFGLTSDARAERAA